MVREKLTGRVFSETSRQKMSESMKEYWLTQPRAKDLRDRIEYDQWRSKVQKEGMFKCSVTGIRPKQLHAHHLFSISEFPSIRYNPQNGVLLDAKVHDAFHRVWGYKQPVTIDLFIRFLKDLIQDEQFRKHVFSLTEPRSSTTPKFQLEISSQTSKQLDLGSETRVYDPQRIMKLHERMVELRLILLRNRTAEEKSLCDQILKTRQKRMYF